jgi:hypothetical protein
LAIPAQKDRSQIKAFEMMLKVEDTIAEDELITHVMEEASFNDTIGEIKDVLDSGYPLHHRVISVNSINMYAAFDIFFVCRRFVGVREEEAG